MTHAVRIRMRLDRERHEARALEEQWEFERAVLTWRGVVGGKL
ncbi:hypothetical protein ACIRF8_28510 [Streptomyces sp. NPDC102406]